MDENCEPIEQKGEMVLRCRGRQQKSRPKGDFFVVFHGISLIIHENVAKFFTFFPFFWHLEAGIGTILFKILWRTRIFGFLSLKSRGRCRKLPLKMHPPVTLDRLGNMAFWEFEPKDGVWNRNWPGRNLRAYLQTTFDKSNQLGQVWRRWAGPLGRYSSQLQLRSGLVMLVS